LLRRHTSMANADVYVYERNQRKYLIKSFRHHCIFSKWLFGSTIRHEFEILALLRQHGFTLAPNPIALLDKYTIVMEFIEGATPLQSARHYAKDTLPPRWAFLECIKEQKRFHEAGFVHGDIRRANILIEPGSRFRLIDWSTAIYLPKPSPFRLSATLTTKVLRNSDNYSLSKIISSYYTEALPDEFRQIAAPNCVLAFFRKVRKHIYRHGIKRLLKKLFHKGESPDD